MAMPTKVSSSHAVALAKKMGLELEGFEAEAEEIWKKLDDMSEKNPVEYQSFLAEQYRSSTDADSSSPKSKCFRPEVGLSVQTRTTGGDGMKVRELGKGKVFHVNLCSHSAVDCPIDRRGQKVSDVLLRPDGLQIPLVLGPVRELTNEIVLDVILHPSVISACKQSPKLKSEVIDLAFEWIETETKISITKVWTDNIDVYTGGLGEKNTTPVLFFVNSDGTAASSASLKPEHSVGDMTDLLSQVKKKALDTDVAEDFKLRLTPQPSFNQAKKSDHPNNAKVVANEKTKQKVSAPASAIRKGFLNGAGAGKLYPDGVSPEGTGGAAGGTYAKFMSKCQIVTVPPPSAEPSELQCNTARKPNDQVSTQSAPGGSRSHAARYQPTVNEAREMENILATIDEDWKHGNQSQVNNDDINGTLADLAKILGVEPPPIQKAVHLKAEAPVDAKEMERPLSTTHPSFFTITDTLGSDNNVAVTELKDADSKTALLSTRISGLPSTFNPACVELLVTTGLLKVIFPLNIGESTRRCVSISSRKALNARTCKASFSKKKGVLTISTELL